jgi:hypothetical protein
VPPESDVPPSDEARLTRRFCIRHVSSSQTADAVAVPIRNVVIAPVICLPSRAYCALHNMLHCANSRQMWQGRSWIIQT